MSQINSKQLLKPISGSFVGTFTGSLQGTASWANNALTASYVTASNVVGIVTSASFATTASFANNATPTYTSSLYGTAS